MNAYQTCLPFFFGRSYATTDNMLKYLHRILLFQKTSSKLYSLHYKPHLSSQSKISKFNNSNSTQQFWFSHILEVTS